MIPIIAALLGDPNPSSTLAEDYLSETEWGRPYAERAKVYLDVSPDETLGDVIARAVEDLVPTVPRGRLSVRWRLLRLLRARR